MKRLQRLHSRQSVGIHYRCQWDVVRYFTSFVVFAFICFNHSDNDCWSEDTVKRATGTDSSASIVVTGSSYVYYLHNHKKTIIHRRSGSSCYRGGLPVLTQNMIQREQLMPLPPLQPLPVASDETNEIEAILDTVSDAEALLACYAYLQRRNMLSEWSNTAAIPSTSSSLLGINHDDDDDETIGFFWENLNELQYFNNNPTQRQQLIRNITASVKKDVSVSLQSRSSTTIEPILKSIEGTEYNYIENFVPGNIYDDMSSSSADNDNDIVAKVMATKLPDATLQNMVHVPINPTTTTNNNYEQQLPMYVNHPNNEWDIQDDEDEDTTPMYRKNYDMDDKYLHYNSDDETYEMILFNQRSNRTKQQFRNSTWKELWYERRWGKGNIRQHQQMQMERRLQNKITLLSDRSSADVSGRSTDSAAVPPAFPTYLATASNDPTAMNLLHSQLLSRMDDDIIANAIVTYVNANRQRSVRRKHTNQQRKSFLLQQHYNIINSTKLNSTNGNNMASDLPSFQQFHYHPITIKSTLPMLEVEQQRRRSEKAKKAYQTRLINQKLRQSPINENTGTSLRKNITTNSTSFQSETTLTLYDDDNENAVVIGLDYPPCDKTIVTPKDAYDRLDQFLILLSQHQAVNDVKNHSQNEWTAPREDDKGFVVAGSSTTAAVVLTNISQLLLFQRDVQLALQPTKLYNRKLLLLRVIRDVFHERGRCIPTSVTNEYKFMTKASVQELASYIQQKINNQINDLSQT